MCGERCRPSSRSPCSRGRGTASSAGAVGRLAAVGTQRKDLTMRCLAEMLAQELGVFWEVCWPCLLCSS